MKRKKNAKLIKLIISLISIGLFVYSYYVVSNRYIERTSQANKEIELIKLQIIDREKMLAQEEEILTTIEALNKQKQDIIDSYPVHIAKEDNFMFVGNLEKNLKLNITSLDVSENKGFYRTILPAIEGGTDTELQEEEVASDDTNASATDTTMHAFVNSINMNFLTSYEGFKELSEYIRNYPEPTVIQNVSVSYDGSTGALAGNLTLNRFFLTGSGKEYMGTPIDGINIGMDNIFGTGGVDEQDNADIDEPDDN